MLKPNPNRQQLLDFINEATSQLKIMSKKIEDLSNGVQYLHLLHQSHPIVKMSKVNLKAYQQYENISNLRILSTYLAQIKAPFSFQVQKVSQRNYQQNLNLLKNLYKFHFFCKQNKEHKQNEKNSQSFLNSNQKNQVKNELEKKKPALKFIVKPPEKLKKASVKKEGSHSEEFDNLLSSKEDSEKIHKILIVLQNDIKIDESVNEKMDKIKKILGLEKVASNSKRKRSSKSNNDILNTNHSIKCEPSHSQSKINEAKNHQEDQTDKITTRSESKKEASKVQDKFESQEVKKIQKKFDCEEIKESMLKKYELRTKISNRKTSAREGRVSNRNIHEWAKDEDQDTKYNQNLLSPDVEAQDKRSNQSSRKPILRKSLNQGNLYFEKGKSLKKVDFNMERSNSAKNETIHKKSEQNSVISLQILSPRRSSERIQEKSKKSQEIDTTG